jgi:hypothetical protein
MEDPKRIVEFLYSNDKKIIVLNGKDYGVY